MGLLHVVNKIKNSNQFTSEFDEIPSFNHQLLFPSNITMKNQYAYKTTKPCSRQKQNQQLLYHKKLLGISLLYNRKLSELLKQRQMEQQTFRIMPIQLLQYQPINLLKNYDIRQYWSQSGRRKLLTFEETCPASMYAVFNNGFFAAFQAAYNNHGDVKITPDDVWLVILLYFSKYVNDNAEQLRFAFVTHQGKKKLQVTTQNQTSQGQWDEFFTLMMAEIKKNTTAGVTQKLQCNFSTTLRVQKILSTAVVMNTFKKYFRYMRCIPMCGIKNVHFGGTLQDWKKIYEKLLQLGQFDVNGKLKKYIKNVSIILLQFIDTYQGKVDLDFWNKIMNIQRGRLGSGSTNYYSGWIIHFFGFEEKTEQLRIESIDLEIEIDNKLTGIKKTVNLVGGFGAVSKEGDIFRPHLSMAILDKVNN